MAPSGLVTGANSLLPDKQLCWVLLGSLASVHTVVLGSLSLMD